MLQASEAHAVAEQAKNEPTAWQSFPYESVNDSHLSGPSLILKPGGRLALQVNLLHNASEGMAEGRNG